MANITQYIADPINKEVTRLKNYLQYKPGAPLVSKSLVKNDLYLIWTLINGSSVLVKALGTRAANQTDQKVKADYETDIKLISDIAKVVKITVDDIGGKLAVVEAGSSRWVIVAGAGETDGDVHRVIWDIVEEIGIVTSVAANTCA